MEILNALRELGRLINVLDLEVEQSRITISGGLAILSQSELILNRIDEVQTKLVDAVEAYKGKVTLVPELVEALEGKLENANSVDRQAAIDFTVAAIDSTRKKLLAL